MIINLKIPAFVEARIKSGFSQRGLSHAIRASSNYVRQLESGERNPSPKRAHVLAQVLNKEFDEIFFVDVVRKSEQETA